MNIQAFLTANAMNLNKLAAALMPLDRSIIENRAFEPSKASV